MGRRTSSPRHPRRPRSSLGRLFRALHHAIFDASRAGRAAEVVAWSNGATAAGVAALVVYAAWSRASTHALWLGLGAAGLTFTLLRLSLVHRMTVWISAALGTLTVAAMGGSLAWLLAHVFESVPAAPSIGAVLGAVAAAALPAWSYAELARHRKNDVPDSLVAPVSMPPSR